jgi:trans-2,3-dihydro-3-hydroxyanthranilate isomerase
LDKLTFFIVDVFAEKKYGGNQLAVFLNAACLTAADMQSIAHETNFAETSFILSHRETDGGYPVRIFTPDCEVPFAGHPTLGTAYIIHHVLEQESNERINLNLAVGQIPVKYSQDGEFWMKQNPPAFGPFVKPETAAEMLGIMPYDIDKRFPIREVSTGLSSIIVPLNSLDAVKRCRIDPDRYGRFLREDLETNILVFSDQTYKKENTLNARVFSYDSGYPEDAATGSANGNLAAYLLEYGYFSSNRLQYRVEQGYEMNRPSLLKVQASLIDGLFDINVGGSVFLTARGEWYL